MRRELPHLKKPTVLDYLEVQYLQGYVRNDEPDPGAKCCWTLDEEEGTVTEDSGTGWRR